VVRDGEDERGCAAGHGVDDAQPAARRVTTGAADDGNGVAVAGVEQLRLARRRLGRDGGGVRSGPDGQQIRCQPHHDDGTAHA
jgi:hypothetical protein